MPIVRSKLVMTNNNLHQRETHERKKKKGDFRILFLRNNLVIITITDAKVPSSYRAQTSVLKRMNQSVFQRKEKKK